MPTKIYAHIYTIYIYPPSNTHMRLGKGYASRSHFICFGAAKTRKTTEKNPQTRKQPLRPVLGQRLAHFGGSACISYRSLMSCGPVQAISRRQTDARQTITMLPPTLRLPNYVLSWQCPRTPAPSYPCAGCTYVNVAASSSIAPENVI